MSPRCHEMSQKCQKSVITCHPHVTKVSKICREMSTVMSREGLHITTQDPAVRATSRAHFLRFCHHSLDGPDQFSQSRCVINFTRCQFDVDHVARCHIGVNQMSQEVKEVSRKDRQMSRRCHRTVTIVSTDVTETSQNVKLRRGQIILDQCP